jgi:hypothetical protein
MLDGDVEAILLFLRNTSFGPEYNIVAIDPKTDETFTSTILLDELNYKTTDVKPDENGLFNVTLPVSKKQVTLKLLTLSDRLDIDRTIKLYPSERIAPVITTRLNKHIVTLDGDEDRTKITTFFSL